ncbi:MAG: ribulose-phosphate 3-epimerase [Lachnospiraceae bacterium]|nr:ribulose-phosphate 3-epimerase [Lachnospiraceae bacterium]
MSDIILSPSILASDFSKLGEQLKILEQCNVPYVHIDVMDGSFVPSISFGMPVIKAIRKSTKAVFDVHLMIDEPSRYIKDFKDAGADLITVHVEACKHLNRTIEQVKEQGLKVGVALNPATPIESIKHVLDMVDMVLIMTVNPGFGGQKYIESCTEKIVELKSMIDSKGLDVDIQVDGGININNINKVIDAGANVIVAGTAVFDKGNIKENVNDIMSII